MGLGFQFTFKERVDSAAKGRPMGTGWYDRQREVLVV